MAELYMAEYYNMTLESYSSSNSSDSEQVVLSRYTSVRFVIDLYVVGSLCLIGIVGNLITVAVLWNDQDHNNPTTWLLRCMACVDIFYLVNCFCFQPLKSLMFLSSTLMYYYPVVDFIARPFCSIAQSTAVWVVLLLTVDRYVAACRPHSRHLRSVRTVKRAAFAGVIVSVAYNLPLFFEIVVVVEPRSGLMFSTFSDLRNNFYYFIIYKTICFLLFRTFLPLLVVFILNVCLIDTLAKRHKMRRRRRVAVALRARDNLNRSHEGPSNTPLVNLQRFKENKSHSMTSMLVVVISLFLLCHVPDSILRSLAIMSQLEVFNELDILLSLNTLGNAMLVFNSSTNFLVYCLLGRKFRRILSQLCCKKTQTNSSCCSCCRCCCLKIDSITTSRNLNKSTEKSNNGVF